MSTRQPDREFLILFVARTGSSHLAELLTSTGVGDVREWLNPAFREGQAKYFRTTNLPDYFAAIRSACPNGVFGQKMTIWFYEEFSREVRLEDHFNFAVPSVFLFRENIVEQAVSLCLAAGRNVFHNTGTLPAQLPDVAYNAADIRQCIESFANEELRLRAFVEQHGTIARYLSYEQMIAADPRRVVAAVGKLIGYEPDLSKVKSAHRKLGDDANGAYAQRFVEEHRDYVEAVGRRRRWLIDGAKAAPLI